MSLRLVFMGTPDFAVPALRALKAAGHDIAAVYCQPPKPAGRGQDIQKTPMHRVAEEMGIAVHTPRTLREAEAQNVLAALRPDIVVVAAYGLLLPQAVLDIPRLGCLNIHGSLLPRWRGAAPIHRALLAGDAETGITIMRMEAGLDTGPMILKDSIPITPTSTTAALHDALADMGARLIVEALSLAERGALHEDKQPDEGVTYAAKLTREEGRIDWRASAEAIDRQRRALMPWPGCFFLLGEEMIKVWETRIVPDMNGAAGELLDDRFTVACGGGGAIRLVKLQRAGKTPTEGEALLRGLRLERGHRFS